MNDNWSRKGNFTIAEGSVADGIWILGTGGAWTQGSGAAGGTWEPGRGAVGRT